MIGAALYLAVGLGVLLSFCAITKRENLRDWVAVLALGSTPVLWPVWLALILYVRRQNRDWTNHT